MNKSIAIKVDHLTKVYKLYSNPTDRLKESLHPFKKKYHKLFYALNDVSFEIKKGETVGIIGKNGAGKSTLLKMITGVLTPTSGRVTVHGKIASLLELGAGFNPELTGIENIYLNGTIMGFTKEEMDQKINAIIEFADIGDFIHQPMKRYSSGMKARLGFSVSINIDPDILIVDEALSVGDALFRRKCFAKMENMCNKGLTILFVSHSEMAISQLCTRAILLVNGEKIFDSQPHETFKQYNRLLNIKENKNQEPSKGKNVFDTLNDKSIDCNIKNSEIDIANINFKNERGEEVKTLIHGEKYTLNYQVYFKDTHENIQCGFLLKTLHGLSIAGAVAPSLRQTVHKVQAGNYLDVRFALTMLLAPGEYFLSVNIRQLEKENIKILNKLVDFCTILVHSGDNIQYTALCNLNIESSLNIKSHEDI